jgi:hypothetical protein
MNVELVPLFDSLNDLSPSLMLVLAVLGKAPTLLEVPKANPVHPWGVVERASARLPFLAIVVLEADVT